MKLPDLPPPTLRLNVERDALAANWRALDRLSGAAAAGAAVKADAYGLGIDAVVPALLAAGARDFFVAHWSEVPAVLRHVAPVSLAVLHGPLRSEDAQFARATGVRPVINSLHQARLWRDAGGGPCDLMVDTGINRLGLPPSQIGDPLIAALEVDTLLSHSPRPTRTWRRTPRSWRCSARSPAPCRRAAAVSPTAPASRSAKAYAFDLSRPGLALYGGVPRPELAETIRQVAFPQAAVLQLRDLSPGDSVGYNATFTADRPLRAADRLARLCRRLPALLERCRRAAPGRRRAAAARPRVDGHGRGRLHRRARTREGDWLDVPYACPSVSALAAVAVRAAHPARARDSRTS
jgi:alanine racemase